jgi:hypothetical protein
MTEAHILSLCILYLGILWNAAHVHNIVAPVDRGNETPWGTEYEMRDNLIKGVHDLDT